VIHIEIQRNTPTSYFIWAIFLVLVIPTNLALIDEKTASTNILTSISISG
jgi:hypothetical protein